MKTKKGEKKPDQKPQDLTCLTALQKVISDISAKERLVKILAPLVKVTPGTVENKELRTRQRYAVVAGLIESGYQPQEPDRLHFCSIQDSIQEGSREYDMRWEHYKYDSKDKSNPDIIVAWIDSEILTAEDKFPPGHDCTPSCNFPFKNLVKAISENNEFYLFDLNDILRQDRSKSVKDHIECIRTSRRDKRCVEKIRLIKPAGMEGETGNQDLAEKLAAELTLRGIKEPQEEVIIILEQGSENASTLASNIQKALGNFFAKQECAKQGCSEQRCSKPDSEKEECREQEPDKQKSGNGSRPASRDEIRNVFYLKGSDGNPEKTGIRDKKDKNENESDDKPERVSVIDLNQPPPLPIGPGQMDHFHRLAEEIRNVHDTVDFEKRDSGAKAVVILGSDFNDKLLIIEALRDKMPHLLILTTDLDARMLYSKHWRSTRNLVVASHFDLRLREKLLEEKKEADKDYKSHFWQRASQDRFPPFRDSQQTNIFYRTLSIAKGNTISIYQSEYTFPRIFEVGRNGFVHLSDTEKNAAEKNNGLDNRYLDRMFSALTFQNSAIERNNASDYHPYDSTQENTAKRLVLLFWIAVFLIWFHFAIRPWSGMLSLYLLLFPSLIFVSAFVFGMGQSGEPLSFTDGVSFWPTIFIQIIAVLLAGALFVRAICELYKNSRVLNRKYSSILNVTVCRNENEADECGPWLKKRLCLILWLRWSSGLRSVRRWFTFFVPILKLKYEDTSLKRIFKKIRGCFTFFILILTVAVYALNDVNPAGFSFWLCIGILAVIAIVYIPFVWDDISIKRWREDDNRLARETGRNENLSQRFHTGQGDQSVLWHEYRVRGRVDYRIARVVAMWLFFAIIETLLAYLLPPWPLPWRGTADLASSMDLPLWTGVISFIMTMLLLFFILDAVRLSFYWIQKLRHEHPLLKEKITSEDFVAFDKARRNDPLELLENIVSLVGERTRAVDKLIYYPMLCIVLMLFAKITYFDNQDFPLSKGITFGAAISVLFFSGFMLRHEANQLKLSVRKCVRGIGRNNRYSQAAIDESLKRIDAIEEGAFQPMLEQPVMQALLVILASIGLFAGEYLKLFG